MLNYTDSDSKYLKKIVSNLKKIINEEDLCSHKTCWLESHPCFMNYFSDNEHRDPYGEPEIYEKYFCYFHINNLKQISCPDDMLDRVLEDYFYKILKQWDMYNKNNDKKLPFYFDKATIRDARIVDKQLNGDIFLDNCNIDDIFVIKKSKINNIYLRNCNIDCLEIYENSDIKNINLVDCTINKISLKNSIFSEILISNCYIKNIAIKDISENKRTQLKNCTVSGYLLILTKATIIGGDFSKANIYNIKDVSFSGSYMRGVKYSSNSGDNWKELKEKYTGFKFLLSTISLIFFISPYLVKVILFKLLNVFEKSIGNGICGESIISKYGQKVECKEYSIVEYLLGFNENKLIFYLTLTLIAYNICRAYLTYKVSHLTNKEGLTGYYPKIHDFNIDSIKDFPNDYMHLNLLDKLMNIMFYIVLASIAYQAYNLLTSNVWIPILP